MESLFSRITDESILASPISVRLEVVLKELKRKSTALVVGTKGVNNNKKRRTRRWSRSIFSFGLTVTKRSFLVECFCCGWD